MLKLFVLLCLFGANTLLGQNSEETEAKGTGISKTDALQDALRNAISQAAGVAIASETKVENYLIVSDAISSNTKGYIQSYNIIKETPFPDRYEVVVRAKVTTETMKADFQLLARQIGGLRFMVLPDPKESESIHKDIQDIIVSSLNESLAQKGCRYIDKDRFLSLKKESIAMMESVNSDKLNYAQQLGLLADAQFLILISDIKKITIPGAFDISRGDQYSWTVRVIDNCTGEGLGSVNFATKSVTRQPSQAIQQAISANFDTLFETITSYIGQWLNNGTPFELRFYNTGTFRDFRDLRKKLKEDPSFGGEMEITSVLNYTKLNCTFRKKADDLADKLLDIADELPNFKTQLLDIKHIYGRQISVAPQKYIIPNIPKDTIPSQY